MKLSVIIPCFNAADTLDELLESLAAQTVHPWEVIVADNGSTDGTPEIARRYQSRLRNFCVIDAAERPGPAYARNLGARTATGDALACCDADDVVAPDWVEAMTIALGQHAFVASRLEFDRLNSTEIRRGRSACHDQGLLQFDPPFLPFAGTAGLGILRSLHLAVGGMDETLITCEDMDYCLRVQLAGTPLHFAANAVVHIRFRTDPKDMFRQAYSWGWGWCLIYKKYMPLGLQRRPVWQTARAMAVFCLWVAAKLARRAPATSWFFRLGWGLGTLSYCVRHRVFLFFS